MSTFVLAQLAQRREDAVRAAESAVRNVAAQRGFGVLKLSNLLGNPALENAPATAQPAAPATPPVRTVDRYVEALSALIPAEVLTLHAFTLSMTTRIVNPETDTANHMIDALSAQGGAAGSTDTAAVVEAMKNATVTVISAPDTLRVAFWALMVFSLLLYLAPRGYSAWKTSPDPLPGWAWYRAMPAADWVRAAIPPLSFVAWTMLQRTTAFDAAFPSMNQPNRSVFGMFLAVVLIAVAAWVAFKPEAVPSVDGTDHHDATSGTHGQTDHDPVDHDQTDHDPTDQDQPKDDQVGHDQGPAPPTEENDTVPGAPAANPNQTLG